MAGVGTFPSFLTLSLPRGGFFFWVRFLFLLHFFVKKTLFCYFLGEVDFNGRINILYSKKVFFKADFWPLSET